MTDRLKRFSDRFAEFTGHKPLSWQIRLYLDHFSKTGSQGQVSLPAIIDLPTGLGKTMVMAIWLIARDLHPEISLPTRLIYVVDRRTVVDQATDIAVKLREAVNKDKPADKQLAISTLRGQLADNREWSKDPTRPAIIIGTVDLIGSALLFSGYRSSFRRRPLESGLLGQDSLLVLDEAHLSKPFENLVSSISSFQSGQGSPMKVIRMSATTSGNNTNRFKLEDFDLADPIIDERFTAKKTLSIVALSEKDRLNDKLASAAIELVRPSKPDAHPMVGQRIVVFVRRPDDARAIARLISDYEVETTDVSGTKAKKVKSKPYADSVEILTGTMRGLERDELIEKPVMKRFLDGDIAPNSDANQQPVFLISTSAGEVGFDLNADHMVCDAAPIDSMIQRLGRVNRRGKGNASIQLFSEAPKRDKDGKTKKLEGIDQAIDNTIKLLTDVTDVSPKNIADLKKSDAWTKIADGQHRSRYELACAPEPTTVELTDILLDAWSMTSIIDRMPGRPDVAPWLRGIADDLPQTTIAWRAELDLPGFDQLDLESIEEWFDTHRILTHETLRVPTSAAAKWFSERWDGLIEEQQREIGARWILVDRAGLKRITIKDLIDQLSRKNTDALRNADLIVPASFGGIERGKGMLDAEASELPKEGGTRPVSPDVADERGRLRQLVTQCEDGDPVIDTIGTGTKQTNAVRFVLELESDDDKTVKLVSYVPKREKLDLGSKRQTLAEHVGLVRKHTDSILSRLDVSDSVQLAAQLAANFHDHGKNRERWQRCIGRLEGEEPLGKSGREMKRDPRGYRHEFGSLREFADAFNDGKLFDHAGKAISAEVFDLAAHLIATHHGRGRPHFPTGGFDPDDENRSDEIQTESIRRFARLQKKYGHWHLAWLENLLRCADALASTDPQTDTKDATGQGGAL